jgi:hypothetical protein
MIDAAMSACVVPRCHREYVTRANIHGVVWPFVWTMMEGSPESGIHVKVPLPETLAWARIHPQAALACGMDTTLLLNRPPCVALSEKSGAAGLAFWIARRHPSLAVAKDDPRIALAEIAELYEDGRTTVLADDEVDAIVRATFNGALR